MWELVAATTAANMFLGYEANQTADARASAANAANAAAADRSRLQADEDAKSRRDELLRRFKITSGKVKDSQQQIELATANSLTSLDLTLAKSRSATDNVLASRHIQGRVAERLKNAVAIQGSMQKGTIVQGAEAQIKDLGSKLESMGTNLETEQMNLDIDLSNAITAADNAEIRGVTYSSSTGLAGVATAGLQGASMGLNLATSYSNCKATGAC